MTFLIAQVGRKSFGISLYLIDLLRVQLTIVAVGGTCDQGTLLELV